MTMLQVSVFPSDNHCADLRRSGVCQRTDTFTYSLQINAGKSRSTMTKRDLASTETKKEGKKPRTARPEDSEESDFVKLESDEDESPKRRGKPPKAKPNVSISNVKASGNPSDIPGQRERKSRSKKYEEIGKGEFCGRWLRQMEPR